MARYSLNLPIDLKKAAEEWASRQGVSLNQFILWAVSEKVGGLDRQLDDLQYPGITYRRGASGRPVPVLRGTGIRVQTIATAHQHWGLSPEQIADEYELTIQRVEEALAFYSAHQSEIDSWIEVEANFDLVTND